MNADGEIAPQHYAFLVSESEFDEIFGRTGLNVDDNSDQARFTEVFMRTLSMPSGSTPRTSCRRLRSGPSKTFAGSAAEIRAPGC
jgi:hypothetical protein